MATVEQKNIHQDNNSEVPSDSELFAGKVFEELSERDVFVGDEDFYKLLTDSTNTRTAAVQQPTTTVQQPGRGHQYALETVPPKRFSIIQKMLIAGIIIIEMMLLFILLKPLLAPKNKFPTPVAYKAIPSESTIEDPADMPQEQSQVSKPLFQSEQPLSLKVARDFYLQEDYGRAYSVYNQLYEGLQTGTEEDLLRDCLKLMMGLCLKKAGNNEQAENLYRTLIQSRSPVIRVVANYNLGITEIQKKQYLKARTRIYRTIGMIGAVDFNEDWVLSWQRNCSFLVAESMTRHILSLCDADTNISDRLWSKLVDADPFTELNEAQLRKFLSAGSKYLQDGSLSPHILRHGHQNVPPHWSVAAHGSSIEELLARFASNTGLDIVWLTNKASNTETGDAVRKRPVSLYLLNATAQQGVEVAAGHVGLLASLDEKGLVKVYNPDVYSSSLSEHINLLIKETILLWRKYILTFHNDKRIPNAHFALGLLQAQKDQVVDAIAEYKLVANRFSQTSLAPYALLNSSKIKADLRDYVGASEDLTQLVEQYPDTELYGQACLNLADTTENAKFFDRAERLYRKVYYLGLSLELQAASALGAGRCSYEIGNYENAEKWLSQYLKISKDSPKEDFYQAYFLLGKTYLALEKHQQASNAFQLALNGPTGCLTREQYVEAVSDLVEAKIQLEDFVGALALLEGVHPWQLSKKESIEMLLRKSKVCRFMGLSDKAILALDGVVEYLPESQLKTRVFFELANCHIAKGDLELAHGILAEILIDAAPGPLAQEIALTLTEVCLKLDQIPQTVSFCLQLLDSGMSTGMEQRILKILAAAYNKQKKYDKAALALLGQWQ
jgi:tetratricopeptide (TPR) repeat protein